MSYSTLKKSLIQSLSPLLPELLVLAEGFLGLADVGVGRVVAAVHRYFVSHHCVLVSRLLVVFLLLLVTVDEGCGQKEEDECKGH